MKIINSIKRSLGLTPFSCKEEEVAFANFLVTKVQHALLDENSEFNSSINAYFGKNKRNTLI